MKIVFKLSALALFAWSATVSAGSVSSAKITAVRVDSSGFGMMFFDKPLTTPAACVPAGAVSRMSFDTKSPGGQAMLSIALSAQVSGKTVTVTGTKSCLQYTTSVESANYLTINN